KKKVFVSGKWRYLGDHSWFDPSRCAWRMLKMPNMETTSSDMSGDDLELQITTSAITDIGVHKAITYDLHLTSLRNEYLCRAYTYNVYKADDGTTYYIRNTSPDAIRIWAGRYRIDIQFNGNFYINHRY
ncbi:MAG: hypothetical protein LBL81_03700, partial [Tannerella sp.]|nr:hypothetical protein [Tannerella sp.]